MALGSVPPQQSMAPLPAQPMVQPMPELSTMERIGYGLMGVDPFSDYNYNLRASNVQALNARMSAETATMEDALRRQQADDAALDLIFRSKGIGPEKGRALLREQDLMAALMQQQADRMKTVQLGILTQDMKRTPLQREQEQWEAVFGGLQGALKNVFGSPEEMADYAQTTQAIQMAQKAERYDKDQVVEGIMSQVRAQASAFPGATPFDDSHRKDASALFDSLLTRGVDANTARQWVGQSLAASVGIPQQDLGPGGFAGLGAPPSSFGRQAFAASMPRESVFDQIARAFGPSQAAPTLESVMARINNPRDASDAKRIGTLLRAEGLTSAAELGKLHPEKLRLLWQRIEGGL